MNNLLRNKFVPYLLFFIYVLFIRLNTISIEIIDWDEATYIMAGREILLGYLPYESLYEMKPPMLYYIYSIPLFINSSLESVRIFGIFCIFLSASFIFIFLKRYIENRFAILGSIVFISIMNYYFWLGTSSEIVCLPLLLLSLLTFIKKEESNYYLFLSGLFISIATLIRLNVAYLVIFLVIYLIFKKNKLTQKIIQISVFSLSGLIPVAILIFLYADKNLLDLLLVGTFQVPLEYASENSLISGLLKYIKTIFKLCYFNPLFFIPIISIFLFSLTKKNLITENKMIFNIFFLGIVFSTIATGQGFSHHLILVLPFVIFFILTRKFSTIFHKKLVFYILILTCINSTFLSLKPNLDLFNNNYNFRKNHQIREISNDLMDSNANLLALDYHLIYFYEKFSIPWRLIHTPAIIRDTTAHRLKPLIKINYFSENFIQETFDKNYEYILCSSRICEIGRPNLDNDKIKKVLKNYKIIKKINNFSKWEHNKPGNLLLYKKLKKSD